MNFNITATDSDGIPEALQTARLAQHVRASVKIRSDKVNSPCEISSSIAGPGKSDVELEDTTEELRRLEIGPHPILPTK